MGFPYDLNPFSVAIFLCPVVLDPLYDLSGGQGLQVSNRFRNVSTGGILQDDPPNVLRSARILNKNNMTSINAMVFEFSVAFISRLSTPPYILTYIYTLSTKNVSFGVRAHTVFDKKNGNREVYISHLIHILFCIPCTC